jgi:hypothetical protein
MTTRADIYAAIRNADAAGDSASVQKLGAYLQTLPPDTPAVSPQHDAIAAKINNDQISQDAKSGPSMLGEIGNQVGNLIAGGVRGAGSIGATLAYPIDKATDLINGDGENRNASRRKDMGDALSMLGADTQSPAYKVGKVGAEIAGTAGAGGAIANGLSKIPAVVAAAPNLLTAIDTAGMSAGNATGGANLLTRVAGGAINGGVSAGLVDPKNAVGGAAVGGAVPVVAKVAGAAGNAIGNGISNAADSASKRLMQSALKPTIKQLQSGDADTAVQTLLDYGVNPTKGGVEKLRNLIDQKNAEIANAISASPATIDKSNVVNALSPVQQKFSAQVSPTADLAAIDNVKNDFLAHPDYPGNDIPVQAAQALKQGTYRVLSGKYGQMGSAETEAQKGLARGLKDEIATAVPEVAPLNAEESRLITTLNVSERRALMEANKNPLGLATLAHNPLGWAAFMADKSALFKSLAARMVNSTASVPGAVQNALTNQSVNQIGYRVAPNALTGR